MWKESTHYLSWIILVLSLLKVRPVLLRCTVNIEWGELWIDLRRILSWRCWRSKGWTLWEIITSILMKCNRNIIRVLMTKLSIIIRPLILLWCMKYLLLLLLFWVSYILNLIDNRWIRVLRMMRMNRPLRLSRPLRMMWVITLSIDICIRVMLRSCSMDNWRSLLSWMIVHN